MMVHSYRQFVYAAVVLLTVFGGQHYLCPLLSTDHHDRSAMLVIEDCESAKDESHSGDIPLASPYTGIAGRAVPFSSAPVLSLHTCPQPVSRHHSERGPPLV